MEKTVLILGATSDIAAATARELAGKGCRLILAARRKGPLASLADDIGVRSGKRVYTTDFDATDFASHEGFYAGLPLRPDGVVCAFGYLGDQAVAERDFDEARRIIDTNYVGMVSLLGMIANDFEQRGKGFIVGISSVAGDRGRKSNYLYGSAKAGLSAFLSGLRNRLSGEGVHVLTVKPGFVDTAMTEGMNLPEKLLATPGEVASDIVNAIEKKRNVLYTKRLWYYIMLIIRHIPEFVFKRLNL